MARISRRYPEGHNSAALSGPAEGAGLHVRPVTWRVCHSLTLVAMSACVSHVLAAQDVAIRGRVTDKTRRPVAGAAVSATALPDSVTMRTVADSDGQFSVRMPLSASEYLVRAGFIGFTPERRRLEHTAGDTNEIVVNIVLTQAPQRLAPITTHATRPKPLREDQRGDYGPGQPTRLAVPIELSDGISGDLTGDLASALATMPGITVIPSAGDSPTVAAFGFSGDQNGTTLNGMAFTGASLPRDGFTVSALSSTYDPSKGGFAGLLASARLRAGTTRSARLVHGSLDSPMLQWGQPGFARASARRVQDVVSGTLSGPAAADHLFYNSAYQFVYRLPATPSLASANSTALRALGVAPDSLARFRDAAAAEGVPTIAPSDRSIVQASAYARLDYQPRNPQVGVQSGTETGFTPTEDQYSILVGGGVRRAHNAVGPTSFPTLGGLADGGNEQISITRSSFGFGWLLNETSVSYASSFDRNSPVVLAPSAQIGIASSGQTGQPQIATLLAGGAGVESSNRQTWTAEARSQTSWATWNRAHEFSVTLDGLLSGYNFAPANSLGGFVYNSLSDFEKGTPAEFTRAAPLASTEGRTLNLALAVGDVFAPTATGSPVHHLAIQYGLRAEVNKFEARIPKNDSVVSEFRIRTDALPRQFAILPMIGFNREFGSFHRTSTLVQSRGSVFGGVREYRTSLAASSLDQHQRETGLAGDAQDVSCLGTGVPEPNWPAYLSSLGAVPEECVSGVSPALSQVGQPVIAFSSDYRSAISWRPTLGVGTFFTTRWSGMASAAFAWNGDRQDLVDVNFSGMPQFTLSSEGERPVFVPASDIVGATGAVLDRDSRLDGAFTHVNEARSDLSDRFGQITLALIHGPATSLSPYATVVSQTIAYTFSAARAQTRGFSSTTGGDPRQIEWSSGQAARHAVVLTQLIRNPRLGQFTIFGRFASGFPFTPLVNTDINGDGYANDRAFVFKPSSAPDTALAAEMATLLNSAPRWARSCLAAQAGRIALPNSCVGEWSATVNMAYSPSNSLLNLNDRGHISFLFTNAAGALDYLLHGQSHLHRWGTPAISDPVLLETRGFDPASRRFLYTVNPSFGRGSRFGIFSPISVSLDVRIDLGPDREEAAIRSFLQPGPVSPLPYLTADEIRARLVGSRTTPIDQVLRLRDSLRLNAVQVERLNQLSAMYAHERDSVYSELATFLATRVGDYGGKEVKRQWHAASLTTLLRLHDRWLELRDLLSPAQYAMVPEPLRSRYDVSRATLERGIRGPIFFPP